MSNPAQPWTAQAEMDAGLAQRVIEYQFPILKPATVEYLGQGWDNTVFRVNGDYTFRFPRRQIAVDLLGIEYRTLPHLAPQLPLAIPEPLFPGTPCEAFPWPFLGARFIPGVTACAADLSPAQRCRLAGPLAEFLASLHAISVAEAAMAALPHDRLAKLDPGRRHQGALENLQKLKAMNLFDAISPLARVLEAARDLPRVQKEVPVHGDFYVRHLLMDENKALCGVIDWGDVAIMSPAVDLAVLYCFLPREAWLDFERAYGFIDDELKVMAAFRGVCHASILVLYGNDVGDQDILREGTYALRQLQHCRF